MEMDINSHMCGLAKLMSFAQVEITKHWALSHSGAEISKFLLSSNSRNYPIILYCWLIYKEQELISI